MISIRKYLYGESAKTGTAAAGTAGAADALQALALGLLDCILEQALSGEFRDSTHSQLTQLKGAIRPGCTAEEASQALETVGRLLAQQRAAAQSKSVSQAVEMQHIFAMLNQALIVLAEGKDRSVARLNRVQESLQQACMIEDIVALKYSLADTMRFITTESLHTQQSCDETLSRFETEVTKTRKFLGSSRLDLPGRPEAISLITDSLMNVVETERPYLVAYLFDRLQAIQQRYGPAVAEEVIFRLIKERLQPVAAGSAMFRWTSSSLVAVFYRQQDLTALRTEVTKLNSTALVHRIALGNRTAVLTVKPSHLVAEGVPGHPNLLIEGVDQFTGLSQ